MKAALASFLQRLRTTLGGKMPALVGLGNALGTDGLPVRLSSRTYAGLRQRPVRELGFDQPLLWVVVALLAWGLVMVYSASIALPDNPRFANYAQTHFALRHGLFIVIGLVAALIAFQVPMQTWERYAPWLFALALLLLVVVLIPFIGKGVNGARRWIPLGVINFQPSELAKLTILLYAADYMVRKMDVKERFFRAVAPMAAQAIGARDFRTVRRTVRSGIWLAIALFVLLFPIAWNIGSIYTWMGQDPELIALADIFIHAAIWSLISQFVFMALQGFLNAHGATRAVLLITVSGVFVNLLANYVLVFGHWGFPALGIMGSGLATSIVNAAMLVIAIVYIQMNRRFRRYHIWHKFFDIDWPRMWALIRIGVPIGLMMLADYVRGNVRRASCRQVLIYAD